MSPVAATAATTATADGGAALRAPRPAPATAPRRGTPLQLVPKRRPRAARTPFAVVLVVLLAGGLLGLLLLNTLVAQQSFRVHDLAAMSAALQQQELALTSEVQTLQAPAALAARATRLGMVDGGPPAFLRLSDGKVLGKPVAGRAAGSSTAGTTGRTTGARAAAVTPAPASPAAVTQPHPSTGTHPTTSAGAAR